MTRNQLDAVVTKWWVGASVARQRGLSARNMIALALAVAASVAACSSGGTTTPTSASGTIVVVRGAAINTMDPYYIQGTEGPILLNMYDGLYTFNDQAQLTPELATAHEVSADGLTHTFTIRSGVKFQDGTLLTPDDVAFSLQRPVEPNRPVGSQNGDIPPIASDVVQGDKLIMTLKTVDPIIEMQLASPAALIVPKAYVTRVGPEAFNAQPIGSGPFKVVSWVLGQSVTMAANPDYWGGTPKVKTLKFQSNPEVATQQALLQSGAANILAGLDPTQIDLMKSAGFRIATSPSGDDYHIKINETNPNLSDVRVRQAFEMVINRQSIVQNIYKGTATISTTGTEGYVPSDASLQPYAYDPQKAKQLLQQAGFNFNAVIDFDVPRARFIDAENAAAVIVSDFAAIGVNLKLNLQDQSVWSDQQGKKLHKGLWWGTILGAYSDAWRPLNSHWTCAGADSVTCDPTFDTLIAAARTLTGAARVTAMHAVVRRLYDQAHFITLWNMQTVYAIAPGISWAPTPYFANYGLRFVSATQTGKAPTI